MKGIVAETTVCLIKADDLNDQGRAGPHPLDLIRQAKAGDREAVEELIIVYQDRIMRLAIHLLGDVEDAKDAAQEVLIRFFKYLDRFDDQRKLWPWLYQMVVNVCRNIGRKKRHQSTISLDELEESAAMNELTAPLDLEAESQAAQNQRMIRLALETLSEKERAALVLRDIEGLSTKEVAGILGSSETTVRSQISMARLKIKKFRDRPNNRPRVAGPGSFACWAARSAASDEPGGYSGVGTDAQASVPKLA